MSDPIDLVTIDRVRASLRIPVTDTDTNDQLADIITDVSAHLISAYRREFAPYSHDPSTRRFTHWGGVILDLSPWNPQAGTISDVTIDADTTSPLTMVENTDWYAMPARSADDVVDYLRLPLLASTSRTVRGVDVTASWGYPIIPRDVARAALLMVKDWYRRDNGRAAGVDTDEDEPTKDVAIPQRARWLLRNFEKRSVFVA